jgi:hypothetical protein
MCTRKGRVPKGILKTSTTTLATCEASASGGEVNSKPFRICLARRAVGPDAYAFVRALSSGAPERALSHRKQISFLKSGQWVAYGSASPQNKRPLPQTCQRLSANRARFSEFYQCFRAVCLVPTAPSQCCIGPPLSSSAYPRMGGG